MKPLIRAIESSPFKNRFSTGQQVTYKYYAGLKAMMDEDYKSGEKFYTIVENCWYICVCVCMCERTEPDFTRVLFQQISILHSRLNDARKLIRRISSIFWFI